jgi:Flp pilus assembly protein TadG
MGAQSHKKGPKKEADTSRPLFLCPEKRGYLSKMLRSFFTKWVRKKDGTTAIEFSLMAIPYIMLTLGIIELSLMYASASLLEGATGSAARLVRTGQIQQAGGDPEQMFRDAVCNYATVLIHCNDIKIEVLQMNSYADYESMAPQYDEDGNLDPQGFSPGGSNDRVLIRVAYRYQMLTPFVGPLLSGADGGTLFMSTIVLQTEPYDFGGAV